MADLARATEKMASFVEAIRHDPGSPTYGFGYSNGPIYLLLLSWPVPNCLIALVCYIPDPLDSGCRRSEWQEGFDHRGAAGPNCALVRN